MDRIIAYCGLVCSDCAAYVATQANDHAALEKVVAQWREEYNVPDITVESVICDGCLTKNGRTCYHCTECTIRTCGLAKGVANCAHCDDYACEKLTAFLSQVPQAKTVLDEIRRSI